MCGRFSLNTPIPELAEWFQVEQLDVAARPARFNIAPTEEVIVVRPVEGEREMTELRWGLVPGWAEDPGDLPLMINARSETLVERPAFRDLVPGRRCVVPADGFYEWRREGQGKQPYYVRRRDERPLALAGLWDAWERPEGGVESCTVITAPATRLLLPLHDRMPVILDDEGLGLWLDASVSDPARALEALGPSEGLPLETFRVSRRVNGIRHDDAELIEPEGPPVRDADGWEDPAPHEGEPEQLGLF